MVERRIVILPDSYRYPHHDDYLAGVNVWIEAAVILALCGFLLFAVMLMRMPGDKEYEMATRRADAQRMMPS